MTRNPKPARDDIGADSASERMRLRARVEELQHQKRRLEIKIIGLQSEISDLKNERAKLQAMLEK